MMYNRYIPDAAGVYHPTRVAPSRRQLRLLRLRSLCARRLLPRLRRPLLRPVRRNMEVFCHGCCRAVLTRGIC